VEQDQPPRGGRVAGEVDIDEVAVGRVPALALELDARRRAQDRENGLEVTDQWRIFGPVSGDVGCGCAGAGEAWCTIMRQPAGVRR
jgi:succinyl-CoA synthetase beta subunit